MVYNRLKVLQDWFLPGSCLLCAAPVGFGADFCRDCEASLPRPGSTCRICAAPLEGAEDTDAPCGECQKRPPKFARVRTLFTYAPPVDRLIQNLKYHRRLELARVLGDRLAGYLASLNEPRPDVIVPVPLHRSRLRERGYNQSLELARPIARRLRLPLDYRSVRRTRATAPQTELPREQRRKNVRGAFQADSVFEGQRVAVVDDVMTSGHTAAALAECLRRAGAKEILVWVVARA